MIGIILQPNKFNEINLVFLILEYNLFLFFEGLPNSYHQFVSLLMSTYKHEWLPWKFSQVSQGFWNQTENQQKFVEWSRTQFNIQTNEDW